ncbi:MULTISPECIES: hypothetical protein [unclassified Imperialibacter]|uniref:hypothetical protein n=1 Tax=unclassified Imperialibacter TaxID=2629706 RepID=UPI00186A8500|nr:MULTISPECIES: hypothetical protein [unclassified Imperialibacter]
MSGFAAARLATSDGPDRRRIQRYSMDLMSGQADDLADGQTGRRKITITQG